MFASRPLVRHRVSAARQYRRAAAAVNSISTTTAASLPSAHHGAANSRTLALGAAVTAAAIVYAYDAERNNTTTHLDARGKVPVGGELIQTGTPVKEPATGILFPQLCNGMYLAGCGVRYKYGLVKVYAVGTYLDPFAMAAVKKGSEAVMEQALLDPTYPRTIRIVMNRNLSIEKYTSAIVEALQPRMKGQELEKLEEFKELNPKVDLVQGAVIEMTIRGDTLLYKNAVGGVGTIRSAIFCQAMCDVYYGKDPASPTHKADVLKGIPKL